MATVNDDSWTFVVEWFDPMPQLKKKYLVKYYYQQNEAEMIDVKSKKLFLKKSACPPEIGKDDFFIGGKILLYSRELDIVDYGDVKTRNALSHQSQMAFVMLTPDSYSQWGKIIEMLNLKFDFAVTKMKSMELPPRVADDVCQLLELNSRSSSVISSGVSLCIMFMREDGINMIIDAADIISKDIGYDIITSKSGTEASTMDELLFGKNIDNSATLDSCTCCVIKPHAFKSKQTGAIIDKIISQGYEISAVQTLHFSKIQAEEFLEVYKGVVPEYVDHVIHLSLGMCVALEVRAVNPVETFRETAGPWSVEMAKELRPETIRATFGEDNIRNAIHCTDLDDDAIAECEYCFRIM
jgi:nucleoside-diphosphate kinase